MAGTENVYNPFAERYVKHPTTDFDTFIHILKGALGAGMLAMPSGFRNIGLWLGLPATVFVSFLSTYCLHMLIRASQILCVRCEVPRLSFSKTMEQAFVTDPKNLVKWGMAMRVLVDVFQVITVLGTCSVYFVNVGKNIERIAGDKFYLPVSIWIIILAVPMLLLCLVRNLKFLVPFSLIANVCVFISLLIINYYIFKDLPNPNERTAVAELKDWPAFFCIALFSLEIVSFVIPCENEMEHPEHFTGCPSVLVAGMGVVSFLYTFLGFFGYFRYGDEIEANISLNLPAKSGWAESVQAMIGFAIFLTILLQFYVGVQIIWSYLQPKLSEKCLKRERLIENCLRVGLMAFSAAVAAAFPKLGPFISLIGAITYSTMGLTFPAIIDLMVIRVDPGYGIFKVHLIKDILIIVLGLSILIAGTIVSLHEFHEEFD